MQITEASMRETATMSLIDLHCDTLWRLVDLGASGDLMSGECSVTIPKMRQAGTQAQFFACFTDITTFDNKGGYDAGYQHVSTMLNYLNSQLMTYHTDIALATNANDIAENSRTAKISALPTVEDGGILNGDINRLTALYDRGIRLITLLWNHPNCLGSPNSVNTNIMQQGLTPFGIEVVQTMGKMGMIVDVSHASDGVFNDVLTHARSSIIASHSNCRELCNHPRNLSDNMIRQLANKGGIAGLNLFGRFLGTPTSSRLNEMTAHIIHMINIGGSDFPAIGTDLDGFTGMKIADIADTSQLYRLHDALRHKGISENQIDKIWNGNAMRIIKETL